MPSAEATHQAVQRLRQRLVDLDDVVVGRREHRLGQALPGLRDAGDLAAGLVLDVEVPGAPVLAVERADLLAARPRARTGSCRSRSAGRSAPISWPLPPSTMIRDFMNFARPGQRQHDAAVGVDDLELVGEELVDVGDEPHHLLRGALADLADRADLPAVLVVDRELLVDLDQLGLLVHHEHRLGEQATRRRTAPACDAGRATSPWTFSVARLTVGHVPEPPGGSTDCRPWLATCSVQFCAVEVAVLVPPPRVGIPVRVRASRSVSVMARTLTRARRMMDACERNTRLAEPAATVGERDFPGRVGPGAASSSAATARSRATLSRRSPPARGARRASTRWPRRPTTSMRSGWPPGSTTRSTTSARPTTRSSRRGWPRACSRRTASTPATVAEVARLVRLTETHDPHAGDRNGAGALRRRPGHPRQRSDSRYADLRRRRPRGVRAT